MSLCMALRLQAHLLHGLHSLNRAEKQQKDRAIRSIRPVLLPATSGSSSPERGKEEGTHLKRCGERMAEPEIQGGVHFLAHGPGERLLK